MSSEGETAAGTRPGYSWTPERLMAIRSRPNRRRAALVATALVGVGLSWFHLLGLFVAGALVGLVSRTVPRAVLAGIVVGSFVLVVHVLASPVIAGPEFLALTPISYVSIAAAVIAPVWGSLFRAVV